MVSDAKRPAYPENRVRRSDDVRRVGRRLLGRDGLRHGRLVAATHGDDATDGRSQGHDGTGDDGQNGLLAARTIRAEHGDGPLELPIRRSHLVRARSDKSMSYFYVSVKNYLSLRRCTDDVFHQETTIFRITQFRFNIWSDDILTV